MFFVEIKSNFYIHIHLASLRLLQLFAAVIHLMGMSPWWPLLGLLSWCPIKPLQLIWSSDAHRFHLKSASSSDELQGLYYMTGYQDISLNNDISATILLSCIVLYHSNNRHQNGYTCTKSHLCWLYSKSLPWVCLCLRLKKVLLAKERSNVFLG